jgi:hypothetical protein
MGASPLGDLGWDAGSSGTAHAGRALAAQAADAGPGARTLELLAATLDNIQASLEEAGDALEQLVVAWGPERSAPAPPQVSGGPPPSAGLAAECFLCRSTCRGADKCCPRRPSCSRMRRGHSMASSNSPTRVWGAISKAVF